MLKQIGKFTISERIGRGTYSRVYRAVDSQGRPVAIKVSTTATEPQQLAEFQRDLVAAASVLHPNLASVHDLGFEDDFPYLVMEFVEGHDLDKLLKSNAAPSLAERIRTMQQVAEALKSAHERGVYHLDIRPSKIMLGDDGVAKLLDLGLGRLSFDPARVTDHGYLVGAPFYMSPERLTAIDTADARCDIWSFGVTFYEWLSGHHPFYDDDGDRMIGNIMDAAPAALAGVPAALNQTIFRAIEKDPADRYQNFTELLSDLRPMVSDLKREESDALMAEALKQTDSGRWHEARRIARQMRDLEPQQGPSSQMFGFSEQEQEKEKIAERVRPAAPPPVAAPVQPLVAAVASAAAATAVDTPEPAPPPPPPAAPQWQPPAQASASQAPLAAPPKPQRPERTAPKLPAMGTAKNGSSVVTENGSAARPKSASSPSNGARMAAAAAAGAGSAAAATPAVSTPPKAAIVREVVREEAAPKTESARPRPSSNPRTTPPQPTVRILEMEEPSSFPWAKIFAFSVPALLMIGLLLFFLRTPAKLVNARGASTEEGKEISPAPRVIKGDEKSDSEPATVPPATITMPAVNGGAQPDVASSAPGALPTADGTPPAPRAFDPKTLVAPKMQVKHRANTPLPNLAAPALANNAPVLDTATLPLAMNAPPPPTAKPVQAPAPLPATPAPTSAAPQSVEAARASASHVGGVFAQPVLVHKVQPIYPPAAMQKRAQGIVHFQATITKDGSVKNLQLLSGDPLLNVAARQAVIQFKYRPAMLNGEPVEVTQAIDIKFQLSQ